MVKIKIPGNLFRAMFDRLFGDAKVFVVFPLGIIWKLIEMVPGTGSCEATWQASSTGYQPIDSLMRGIHQCLE